MKNLLTKYFDNYKEDGIDIKEFSYKYCEKQNVYDLILTISSNDSKKLRFTNISNLNLRHITGIIRVTGFEIIDHQGDGWSSEMRYEIRDYEEDRISFYCENISLNDS